MERLFQILAVILAGIAAYFLWRGNIENAFLTAIFGAVAFFLSVRFQVHERMKQRQEEREKRREGEDEISDSEMPELNEVSAGEQIKSESLKTDKEQI